MLAKPTRIQSSRTEHRWLSLRTSRSAALLLGLLSTSVLTALESVNPASPSDSYGQLVALPEAGWAQWRGPLRNGICTETNLLTSWPEGGPNRLWIASGLGRGYSAPVITADRIFLAGDHEDELLIHALDREGRPVWRTSNGAPWRTPYPGARASCTISEGKLYHLNAHGRVTCLKVEDGSEVWAFNLFEQFGGRNLTWALSECLLVDGPRLIVTPGGSRALMAALDKHTGETLWITPALRLGPGPNPAHQRVLEPTGEIESASYASPVLVDIRGQRQIIGCSLRHAFGVHAESGKLLWTQPLPTRFSVIAATPVWTGDAVFVTAPDTAEGGMLLRPGWSDGATTLDLLWRTPLDTCHGGVVHLGDSLYGSWYRRSKGWARVDLASGQVRYSLDDLAKGSILATRDRLYCLSEEGEMALLRPGTDRFHYEGRFRLVEGRVNDAWTHPVILDGRLYLRYHDTLSCYDIRKP